MQKVHIATLLDKDFLIKAATLYESALKFMPNISFWFLCLDNESEELLNKLSLDGVKILNIRNIDGKELESTRKYRTRSEFAWTCKPSFIMHITQKVQNGDMVAYVDSDVVFLSSWEEIIKKMANYSIGITPHKFPENKKYLDNQVGHYNAGVIFFKNDQNSKKCLEEWRRQCIDWCYHRLENGKMSDQMYLNNWGNRYNGVYDIPDKGVNLGSWNIGNFKIKESKCGKIFVDDDPLICYHFHGLKLYLSKKNEVSPYPINICHDKIYKQYIELIQKTYDRIIKTEPNWHYGFSSRPNLIKLTKQKIIKLLKI